MERTLLNIVSPLCEQKGKSTWCCSHSVMGYYSCHCIMNYVPPHSVKSSISSSCVGCRISITFRKMDDRKLPYRFSPDPELQGIMPLVLNPLNKLPVQLNQLSITPPQRAPATTNVTFAKDEFPPLGGGRSTSSNKQLNTRWDK